MNPPISRASGARSPESKSQPFAARAFHMWLAGAWILGRFLWFTFNFILLMLPLNFLLTLTEPGGVALFSEGRFQPQGLLGLAALVLYVPFAAFQASRLTRAAFAAANPGARG